ncbi:hypothetical protein HYV86_01695 [Candidatus Woesearchaeota archaeon]|nr:hypothetical protein [Candidatus Woesearchaeota archaeon]
MAGFRAPKKYGEYQQKICGFCPKIATTKNEQGLEVCVYHVKQVMDDIKCLCGRWLEIRSGKFGAFFNCINCGNLNYNKAMEMKEVMLARAQKEKGNNSEPIHSSDLHESSVTSPSGYISSLTASSGKVQSKPAGKPLRRINDDDDDDSRVTTISSRDVDYF